MALQYGYAKGTIVSGPFLKAKRLHSETQYHEHFGLNVGGANWDVAANVGTNDADDLVRYKLVFDFHHPILAALDASEPGPHDLTGTSQLPALDFDRSDILAETGAWRESDPMDGSEEAEPVASLKRALVEAKAQAFDVYVFGRFYREGDGVHDVHFNQGSGAPFLHRRGDDSNDHNDVWQDGALMINRGAEGWAAYFAMFTQQTLKTDDLGNPEAG